MTKELEFHPLSNIFPLMEGEEFDALVADIKKNGLQTNLVIYGGMILDERNRYRALRALGADPESISKKHCRATNGRFITDPSAYVIGAKAAQRGLIPTIRIGRLVRVPVRAMEAMLDRASAKAAS